MRICYFVKLSNPRDLADTFYGQDIGLLEELGHRVLIATSFSEIQSKPDLVYAWWFYSGFPALIAARMVNRPCVMVGIDPPASGPSQIHRRLLVRFAIRHADALVTNSHFHLQRIQAEGGRNVWLAPTAVETGPRVGRAARQPIVLTLGATGLGSGSRRRLDSLLEAVPRLHREFPQLQFYFAGHPGHGFEELKRKAVELKVEDAVKFLGRIAYAARDRLFDQALMLVHPVIHEELAIAQVEAMGHGLPVITAAGPVSREIGGEAMLACAPASSEDLARTIASLAANPERWETLSLASYQRAASCFTREQRRAVLQQALSSAVEGATLSRPATTREPV